MLALPHFELLCNAEVAQKLGPDDYRTYDWVEYLATFRQEHNFLDITVDGDSEPDSPIYEFHRGPAGPSAYRTADDTCKVALGH